MDVIGGYHGWRSWVDIIRGYHGGFLVVLPLETKIKGVFFVPQARKSDTREKTHESKVLLIKREVMHCWWRRGRHSGDCNVATTEVANSLTWPVVSSSPRGQEARLK